MKYYHFYPERKDELADIMNMIYKFLVEKNPDVMIGIGNLKKVYDFYVDSQKEMLMTVGFDYILQKAERLLKKVRNFEYLFHFVDRFDKYSRFSPEKMVYTYVASVAPSLQGEYKTEQAKLLSTVERYISKGGNDAFIMGVISHYLVKLCNKQKIDMAEPIEKWQKERFYVRYKDLKTLKDAFSNFKGPVQFWRTEKDGIIDKGYVVNLMHASDPEMLKGILKDEINGLQEAKEYWLCKEDSHKKINIKIAQAECALKFINQNEEQQ